MRINSFSPEITQGTAGAVPATGKVASSSFADELASKIQEVNKMQVQSDQAMEEGALNGATKIHETMIKIHEADISLRLLSNVRNKAMDAYHEIMRMQF